MAANALDYDKISALPGETVRRLWTKMDQLREVKNGARYSLGGETKEVRALRNVEKWKAKDADRDSAAFAAEILKNDITGGTGMKVVK